MPKSTSNDALVQRHKQLRQTLIDKHAMQAAQKIVKLKKQTVEEVTKIIAEEFQASQL